MDRGSTPRISTILVVIGNIMNVVLSVTFTGTPDADDTRTAYQMIFVENQRRLITVPPGTPLPSSTPGEVKASYLAILSARVTNDHINNIRLSKNSALSTRFTQDQIDQMSANLIDQLNSGATVGSVIAKTV